MTILSVIMILSGCTPSSEKDPDAATAYTSVPMTDAEKLMQKEDGHILIDVRTQEEYAEGHIPYAINIPLDSIVSDMSELLPDKQQILLVYCRSGNRSKQAAAKLSDLGYTNIYEIGGIIDWKGDIVIEDLYQYERAEIDCNLIIETKEQQLNAFFVNNDAVKALIRNLQEEKQIKVKLQDYGNFEKVGNLPWSLPANDEWINAVTGDVVLYEGDKISIIYGENSWNYTRIGHLNGMSKDEILDALGKGDITVTLFLDYWDY